MSENSLRDVRNAIKRTNIHKIGVSKEESKKGVEILFKEIMAETPLTQGKKQYQI